MVSQSGSGSDGDCCLVTSDSYATQLSPFTIKIFRFNIKLLTGDINVKSFILEL